MVEGNLGSQQTGADDGELDLQSALRLYVSRWDRLREVDNLLSTGGCEDPEKLAAEKAELENVQIPRVTNLVYALL